MNDGLEMTIRGTKGNYWSGLSSADLRLIWSDLNRIGTLSKAHYIVELSPYSANSPLKEIPIFQTSKEGTSRFNIVGYLPWLAQSVDVSIIDAQSDSINAGHFQQNYMTGNQQSEVSITFLETKNCHISRSAQAIKKIMFKPDGTQGLPAEYLMWLEVSLFRRNDREDVPFVNRCLVALQSAKLDLAADDRGILTVPLTFTKMYPMMWGDEQ